VGDRGRGVAHTGPTAVPGLPAQDVLDLQLGVDSLRDADAVRDALQDAGFPAHAGHAPRTPADAPGWPQRLHGSADPGRPARLHVREIGSPGWRYALLLRDWLRSDAAARDEYLGVAREAAARNPDDLDGARYDGVEGSWSDAASSRADAWAATSAWVPSLD
jgi:dephospho-CoA kinase